MRTLVLILFLAGSGFCKKLGSSYEPILNSFGCERIAIVNDTLRLDTNCDNTYDKKAVSDTSNIIETGNFDNWTYIWNVTSAEATADSATYQDEVMCYDNKTAIWAPVGSWSKSGGVDSIVNSVDNANNGGQFELRLSTCDKVRFVAKVRAISSHSDTINVLKRYLRLQEIK